MRRLAGNMVEKKSPRSRAYRRDAHVREHGEKQVEVWLKAGLEGCGLKPADLAWIKGPDSRKLLLADVLWRRTVVSQE